MQIECTRKLLDFLEKEALPCVEEADPFYCWTASLITVNRRRTLIAINNATHCGFSVYGLTAPVRKKLDRLIPEAIRQMMEREGIPSEWIEGYLKACGERVSYTKTRGRAAVGKLNRLGIELQGVPGLRLVEGTFQPFISDWISREVYRVDGAYLRAGELLRQEFQKRSDRPMNTVMAVVNVRLADAGCVRQLRIPGNFTLFRLHEAIQRSMCWQDAHEHMFGDPEGLPMDLIFPEYLTAAAEDDFLAAGMELEGRVTVLEAFQRTPTLMYLYDLGDSWTHEVTLVRTESDARTCGCLLAIGDAPPEDVGGAEGFREFRSIRQGQPEYERTRQWAAMQGWEPLNVEAINRRLAALL